MRVLCIHSVETYAQVARPLKAWVDIPYGLATIAAILEREGHEIATWVFCPATPLKATVCRILGETQPDLVAFTAVTSQFPQILSIARAVKALRPDLYTVLGGHHASLAPEDAIASTAFDAICIGEGDEACVQLAAQLAAGRAPSGIANLWLRDRASGMIERNPTAPFRGRLDDVPFINRRHWTRWICDPDHSSVVVMGRGCPYRCTYCSNHALGTLAEGRYVRMRSVPNILAEITRIVEEYPKVRDIYLEIETIGAFPKAALELAAALTVFNASRERPLVFGCNLAVTTKLARDEDLTERMLRAFAGANIRYLNIGLESGSQAIRDTVLRRPRYTNDELVRFCERAAAHGIDITLYALIGLPDETLADYMETLQVVRRCNPAKVYLSIFYPYPGTDLHRLAEERGYFRGGDLDGSAERSRAVLDMPGFSGRRIYLEYLLFAFRAYRGRWSRKDIAMHVAWAFIRGYPRMHSAINRVIRSNRYLLSLFSRHRMVRTPDA